MNSHQEFNEGDANLVSSGGFWSMQSSDPKPLIVPLVPEEEPDAERMIIPPDSRENKEILQMSKESLESEALKIKTELNGLARKTVFCAFELGQILTVLKSKEGSYGKWEGYLQSVLKICPRSARNYITIFNGLKGVANFSRLLKSESVADLGIKNVLEYLREQKKRDEPVTAEGLLKFEPQKKPKQKTTVNESAALADGKALSKKKLGWNDGLVRWDELSSSKLLADEPGEKAEHTERAQVQQMALILIAALNKGCGSATKAAVAEVFESAVEEVRCLLVEQNDVSVEKATIA